MPRVFEKVYNSAEQKAEAGGKGKIFRAAAHTAVEHSRLQQEGKKVPLGTKIKFALFDRLVYSKLRTAMGGNIAYAVSGSAPLGPRLGHFFHSLGVTILEGYGLTETTAPATVNQARKSKIGTVGPVIPGVGIRLGDDGEIQVRGVNVFKEYWRNPEATAEAFDGDWFKTGDLGAFDDEGFLTITGRKKEIIVTAGGKNVAPAALEDPIRANPIVGQVVVVGDQKPFIAALVTLDPEMLPTWLANNSLPADMSLTDAAKNDAVRAEIQKAIDRANTSVSRAESIRKFTILPTEWTEASGHLTPKMSIKRNVILVRLRGRRRGDLRRAREHDERLALVTGRWMPKPRAPQGPGLRRRSVRPSCVRVKRQRRGNQRRRLGRRRQNQSDSRISRIATRRASGVSRSR